MKAISPTTAGVSRRSGKKGRAARRCGLKSLLGRDAYGQNDRSGSLNMAS
jgi:hypothetical protein